MVRGMIIEQAHAISRIFCTGGSALVKVKAMTHPERLEYAIKIRKNGNEIIISGSIILIFSTIFSIFVIMTIPPLFSTGLIFFLGLGCNFIVFIVAGICEIGYSKKIIRWDREIEEAASAYIPPLLIDNNELTHNW